MKENEGSGLPVFKKEEIIDDLNQEILSDYYQPSLGDPSSFALDQPL